MSSENERDPALERAIEATGGVAALAKFISENDEPITTQAISQWKRCPPNRVLLVERATLEADTKLPPVLRHELRPDLYPPSDAPKRRSRHARAA